MNQGGRVIAELTFLSRSEGGRRIPPDPNSPPEKGIGYLPHIVVDGTTDYLGVRFERGPEKIVCGEKAVFELALFYPAVDYSALVPGARITVREGHRVVARGCVLERR